jgi:hypothetical protein
MQRNIGVVLLLVLFGTLLPCSGQTASKCDSFDPTGTWFGGADFKYQMQITGSMSLQLQAAYNNAAFGPAAWTQWSGTIKKSTSSVDVYTLRATSVYVFPKLPSEDPYAPPTANEMEMDILQGTLQVLDCDTLQHTANVYGAYHPFRNTVKPFVTPVDYDYMPSNGALVEVYRRIPKP